jgi:hypothetical protein
VFLCCPVCLPIRLCPALSRMSDAEGSLYLPVCLPIRLCPTISRMSDAEGSLYLPVCLPYASVQPSLACQTLRAVCISAISASVPPKPVTPAAATCSHLSAEHGDSAESDGAKTRYFERRSWLPWLPGARCERRWRQGSLDLLPA